MFEAGLPRLYHKQIGIVGVEIFCPGDLRLMSPVPEMLITRFRGLRLTRCRSGRSQEMSNLGSRTTDIDDAFTKIGFLWVSPKAVFGLSGPVG